MILQINKEPDNDTFWVLVIVLIIILFILSSLDSNAKPKPKIKYKDYPLPIIIQSSPNPYLINEGEWIKWSKLTKGLLA